MYPLCCWNKYCKPDQTMAQIHVWMMVIISMNNTWIWDHTTAILVRRCYSIIGICSYVPVPIFPHPPPAESLHLCLLHTDGLRQWKDHKSCPQSHLPGWLSTIFSAMQAHWWTLPSAYNSEKTSVCLQRLLDVNTVGFKLGTQHVWKEKNNWSSDIIYVVLTDFV